LHAAKPHLFGVNIFLAKKMSGHGTQAQNTHAAKRIQELIQ
jgi:hypothetical protein